MPLTIPYLQFRSNSIIQFTQTEYDSSSKRYWQDKLTSNLGRFLDSGEWESVQDTYTGKLCPGAKKRLTRCVELMCMATKNTWIYNPYTRKHFQFKIGFITLTVYSPDKMIHGKEAHKQCLEPFLLWCRRKYGMKMYIWKAELQQRGQIHYHLTVDSFIPKEALAQKWNELQIAAGYLDMNEYQKKFGPTEIKDVPSTKIHSVYKKKSIAGYITKCVANEMEVRFQKSTEAIEGVFVNDDGVVLELIKSTQSQSSIHGKVWDCSINLKQNSYFLTIADQDYCDRLWKMVQDKQASVTYTDTCIIWKLYKNSTDSVLRHTDKISFDQRMFDIRNLDITLIRQQQAKKRDIIETKQHQIVMFTPIPDLFSTS